MNMDQSPVRITPRAPDGSPVIRAGRGDAGPVFLVHPCNLLVLCPEGYEALHGTQLLDSLAGCDHPLVVVDGAAGIPDAIQARREALGPVFEPDWGAHRDLLNPLAAPWLPAEGLAGYLDSLAAILAPAATRPLLAEFLAGVMERRAGLARLVLGTAEDPSLAIAARIAARLRASAEDPATAAETAAMLRECGITPQLGRLMGAEAPEAGLAALQGIESALAQFREGRRSARSRNIDFEALRSLDPATVFLCHGDAAGGACTAMAVAALCAQLREGPQDRELTILATLDEATPRMLRMLLDLMAEGRERGISVVLCARGIGQMRAAGLKSAAALRTLLDTVLCLGPPEDEETMAWLVEPAVAAAPWPGVMQVLERYGLWRRDGSLRARLAGLEAGRGVLFQAGRMGAPMELGVGGKG